MTALKEQGLALANLVLEAEAALDGPPDGDVWIDAAHWAVLVEGARTLRDAAQPKAEAQL